MPVVNKEEVQQSKEQMSSEVESKQNDTLEHIKGLDIFKTLDSPVEEEVNQEEEQQLEEETPVKEEQQEEEEQQDDEDATDDVIPKSKFKKRVDSLTRELRLAREENERLKTSSEPKDEMSAKLENMSEIELKNLKRQVRSEQLRSNTDDNRLNQLLDLEEKIDDTIRRTPQRFNEQQQKSYQQEAQKIMSDENFDESHAQDILKIASDIYSSDPDLQKDIKGQALALRMAYRHYRELGKLKQADRNNSDLKAKVNTLKKRTALDTRNIKGNADQQRSSDLRRKAFEGGSKDREAFFSSQIDLDRLLKDDFKER